MKETSRAFYKYRRITLQTWLPHRTGRGNNWFFKLKKQTTEASTASLEQGSQGREFRTALIYKYSHLQLIKKKKETFSPLPSVFSFPFRGKKKKKKWMQPLEAANRGGWLSRISLPFARSYKCILESKQWRGYWRLSTFTHFRLNRARLLAGKIIYTAWTRCPISGWGCRKEGGEMRHSWYVPGLGNQRSPRGHLCL